MSDAPKFVVRKLPENTKFPIPCECDGETCAREFAQSEDLEKLRELFICRREAQSQEDRP